MEWTEALAVFAIAAVFFALSRWLNKRASKKEERYAAVVIAEIIRVDFQAATGEQGDYDKYRGILRYQIEEKEYIKQTPQVKQKLEVGQKINIYYDPQDPDAAVFEKGGGSFLGGLCFLMGLLFSTPFVYVAINFLVHLVF